MKILGFFMKILNFFLMILRIGCQILGLILLTYSLYGVVIMYISFKKCIYDIERGELGEIMYRDEKICIIRQNKASGPLYEFDQITIQNGKKYLLAHPEASCFLFIYEHGDHKGQRYSSPQSIEKLLGTFNNYYEDASVHQLLEYYTKY